MIFYIEDLDEVMFDEGDFEVVDECTGEEDPAPSPMATENSGKGEPSPVEVPESVDLPKSNEETPKDSAVLARPAVDDGPDFTEDVDMDGPPVPKAESTSDDTLYLDASDIPTSEIKEDGRSDAENSDTDSKQTESVQKLISPEHAWYEEKASIEFDIGFSMNLSISENRDHIWSILGK